MGPVCHAHSLRVWHIRPVRQPSRTSSPQRIRTFQPLPVACRGRAGSGASGLHPFRSRQHHTGPGRAVDANSGSDAAPRVRTPPHHSQTQYMKHCTPHSPLQDSPAFPAAAQVRAAADAARTLHGRVNVVARRWILAAHQDRASAHCQSRRSIAHSCVWRTHAFSKAMGSPHG